MTNQLASGNQVEEDENRSNLQRWLVIGAGALGGAILLILVIGLILALIDADYWAPRLSSIRDIFIIIVALEFILIIAALTVLILQVARLINLLQSEVKPILDNTKETVNTAKGTAQFVGKNVTSPLIRLSAFWTGFMVFLREWGGIRRAIRRTGHKNTDE